MCRWDKWISVAEKLRFEKIVCLCKDWSTFKIQQIKQIWKPKFWSLTARIMVQYRREYASSTPTVNKKSSGWLPFHAAQKDWYSTAGFQQVGLQCDLGCPVLQSRQELLLAQLVDQFAQLLDLFLVGWSGLLNNKNSIVEQEQSPVTREQYVRPKWSCSDLLIPTLSSQALFSTFLDQFFSILAAGRGILGIEVHLS